MERVSATTDPIDSKSARPDDLFSTETGGLSEAARPQLIRLHDGDRFDLRLAGHARIAGSLWERPPAWNERAPSATETVRKDARSLPSLARRLKE